MRCRLSKDRVRFVRLYALVDREGVYCLEVLSSVVGVLLLSFLMVIVLPLQLSKMVSFTFLRPAGRGTRLRKDRIRIVRLSTLGDRDGVYCLEVLSYEFCCRGDVIVVFNGNFFTTPIVEDGRFHFPETGWLW